MTVKRGVSDPNTENDSTQYIPSALSTSWIVLTRQWLAQCRIEGHTAVTLETYRVTVKIVQRAIEQGVLGEDCARWTEQDMLALLDWMLTHRLGGGEIRLTTLQHRQRTVRAFLNWAAKRSRRIPMNPMDGIKNVKQPQVLKPVVRQEEFLALLEELSTEGRPALMARNKAIVLMLYDTGPRMQELCGLRYEDVDFGDQIIRVREGKGRKERLLPLSDGVYVALSDYVYGWRPRNRVQAGEFDGPLFYGEAGDPITPVAVKNMLRRLGEKVGLSYALGAHLLRHSFITTSLDNGADLLHVQDLAGHSNPKTTLGYAKRRDLLRAAEAHKRVFSPVERALGGIRELPRRR